jgi:CheY-like chemotaxis protein
MSLPVVLVIDDTPANLKLAEFLLKRAQFEVWTAQDAMEAWAVVRAVRPDVILMDLQLPGIDGFRLTGEFKAEASLAGVPIVAMTAYAMTGDERRARDAGCDGYLSKPLDPASFAERVRGYIVPGGDQAATLSGPVRAAEGPRPSAANADSSASSSCQASGESSRKERPIR